MLEFCNAEFDGFCRKQGIERHMTYVMLGIFKAPKTNVVVE